MGEIRKVLISQIQKFTDLQNLAGACGENPCRAPPKPTTIKKVRQAVGKVLGLSGKQAEHTHPASPWKWRLVREVQRRTQDPDVVVSEWLEKGAPFGVALPIQPGGLLPAIVEQPTLTAEDLYDQTLYDDNHRSFKETVDGSQPALDELQGLVDAGFARVCRDREEAEKFLGQRPLISPLGNVTKVRQDGSLKHRLIQDFRASSVNQASSVSERQVLPRFADHGADLAALSALGSSVGVFVLDFKHAFMTVPLAQEEMAFNASVVPGGISRSRKALDDDEAESGEVLLWRVLGFGGHANPLVYSRIATVASRTGQALLFPQTADGIAHGRLQLYVDDPAVVVSGSVAEQRAAIDLLVTWFLVLGIPLSWKKGYFVPADQAHVWIGVSFVVREQGVATLSLPPDYLQSVLELAQLFASPSVTVATMKQAQELCGKAGRISQVVPSTRPFLSGLYGALAGSINAARHHGREAPPGKVATRRYKYSAEWLVALLQERPGLPLALSSEVHAKQATFDKDWRVEFDASPWGGAGIFYEKGVAMEFFTVTWTRIPHLKVETGDSSFQTFWELLTLALCMQRWCPIRDDLLFCGDNVSSLNMALAMKGSGIHGAICREIAWRVARFRWAYAVAHLPAENNKLADRLSRLRDPSLPELEQLPEPLVGAAEVQVSVQKLWSFSS